MTIWQQLVFRLCVCAVLTGLVRLLMPSGIWLRIGQAVSVCLLVATVVPTVIPLIGQVDLPYRAIDSLEPASVVTQEGIAVLEQVTVKQTQNLIQKTAEQFAVTIKDLSVQTQWQNGQVTVQRITVAVEGDTADREAFYQGLSQQCTPQVVIERGGEQ